MIEWTDCSRSPESAQMSRSALSRNGYRFVSMISRARIGVETTPLLRKSAALNRKVRIRFGGLGYVASQTLTDVPEAAWRSQAVWCGLLSPGVGVSAAAGRAAGVVDCHLACSPIFQTRPKRPLSGAIAVGMARLGGFDPEFPVENGTRHAACCRVPHWAGMDIDLSQ